MVVKAYLYLCSRLDGAPNVPETTQTIMVPMETGIQTGNEPVKTEIELTDIESLGDDDPIEITPTQPTIYPTPKLINNVSFFTGNLTRDRPMTHADAFPPTTDTFDTHLLDQTGLSNLLAADMSRGKVAKMMKRMACGADYTPKRKREDRQLAPGML